MFKRILNWKLIVLYLSATCDHLPPKYFDCPQMTCDGNSHLMEERAEVVWIFRSFLLISFKVGRPWMIGLDRAVADTAEFGLPVLYLCTLYIVTLYLGHNTHNTPTWYTGHTTCDHQPFPVPPQREIFGAKGQGSWIPLNAGGIQMNTKANTTAGDTHKGLEYLRIFWNGH